MPKVFKLLRKFLFLSDRKSYENEKLICIFHGFEDSPVSLYDESVRIDQICRFSNENFFAVWIDNKLNENIFYFFDFNKSLVEIKLK